jgi:predicted phosphoribosyltransferase
LAVGAIASGDVLVTNDDLIRNYRVEAKDRERITEAQRSELARREKAYRGDRPPVEITGKTVILVDDGLATGATMNAALRGIRAQSPARVVVAVPVAPLGTCEELSDVADEVVCAVTPQLSTAVGAAYENFEQTSDEEVADRLRALP